MRLISKRETGQPDCRVHSQRSSLCARALAWIDDRATLAARVPGKDMVKRYYVSMRTDAYQQANESRFKRLDRLKRITLEDNSNDDDERITPSASLTGTYENVFFSSSGGRMLSSYRRYRESSPDNAPIAVDDSESLDSGESGYNVSATST